MLDKFGRVWLGSDMVPIGYDTVRYVWIPNFEYDQIGSDRTGFFLVTSDKKKPGYTFANIHSSKRVTVILNQMLIRIGV